MNTQQEFISKYDRNSDMVRIFIDDFTKFINYKNCGDSPAFAGSDVTCSQYLQVIKEVSETEYSKEQAAAIRTKEIHPNAIKDYIQSLDNQYNSLKALHDEIKPIILKIE